MSNIDDDDCEDDMNDGISPPTPGPWRVITSWCDYMVEGPNGEQIIWQDGPYETPTIKLSDARLIAAAPEMLELIELLAESTKKDYAPSVSGAMKIHILHGLQEAAEKLLAKIEGGGE